MARDFAVDMIDLVSSAGVPVVWALDPIYDCNTLLTPMDVLKHITLQVLRLNHTMLNERSATLNAARFQSTTTEAGWFSLLGAALQGMKQLYVIVDLELLDRSETSGHLWLEEFPRLFQSLRTRNINITLKVALFSPLGTQEYSADQIFGKSAIKLSPRSSGGMRETPKRQSRFDRKTARKSKKRALGDLWKV